MHFYPACKNGAACIEHSIMQSMICMRIKGHLSSHDKSVMSVSFDVEVQVTKPSQ